MWPYALSPTRLHCPWDSPGKNTRVGCCAHLQRIFLSRRTNLSLFSLLHWLVGSLPLALPGMSQIIITLLLFANKHPCGQAMVFPVVMYGCVSWTIKKKKKKLTTKELTLFNCNAGEDSWESLGLQGDQICQFWWKSILNIYWNSYCWSWGSSPLATWCKELTHWKRPWCWERLKAKGEEGGRGWDGLIASST